VTPPTITKSKAYLTSSMEKISGQIDDAILLKSSKSLSQEFLISKIFSTISSERIVSLKFCLSFVILYDSIKVSWKPTALIA
jgi:hypothetical protein